MAEAGKISGDFARDLAAMLRWWKRQRTIVRPKYVQRRERESVTTLFGKLLDDLKPKKKARVRIWYLDRPNVEWNTLTGEPIWPPSLDEFWQAGDRIETAYDLFLDEDSQVAEGKWVCIEQHRQGGAWIVLQWEGCADQLEEEE